LCQVLRLNATVTTAFGDTWNGTSGISKFYSDWADQYPQPYLVFDEVRETYERNTQTPSGHSFIATGTILCPIWQGGREAARTLASLVCATLNNCDQVNGPITWPEFGGTCTLEDFYMISGSFDPNQQIGPGIPATFNRVVAFTYQYQGYSS
jgi:hypothetical protein